MQLLNLLPVKEFRVASTTLKVNKKVFHMSKSELLIEMIISNKTDKIISLLQAKFYTPAELNAKDEVGMTPLYWAVSVGSDDSRELCEALIEAGADPFVVTTSGDTLIHAAAIANRGSDVSDLLVVHGVDLTDLNNKGQTAISIAKFKHNDAFLKAAERYDLTICNLIERHIIELREARERVEKHTQVAAHEVTGQLDELPPVDSASAESGEGTLYTTDVMGEAGAAAEVVDRFE